MIVALQLVSVGVSTRHGSARNGRVSAALSAQNAIMVAASVVLARANREMVMAQMAVPERQNANT
jgi:hypothetical protein